MVIIILCSLSLGLVFWGSNWQLALAFVLGFAGILWDVSVVTKNRSAVIMHNANAGIQRLREDLQRSFKELNGKVEKAKAKK